MKPIHTGGGWPAVRYTLAKAREVGGFLKLWKAMRTKNACKTCALGMGGQAGGMVNEAGHFPEVCKKSLQAMASDMQGAVRDEFYTTYSIPQLQLFSPRDLENCGRITTPLVLQRGAQYYRPIGWDDALDRIAGKLAAVEPRETFWYSSGRSSNEAGFLLQLVARLYGTNNVNNCSYYCHQASGVGLTSAIGTGTATVSLDDVEQADLVFIIGGNPASNHPRLMRTLMQVRRRRGQVIVINPVVETGMVNFSVPSDVRSMLFGSSIASLYVQPHVGGDLSLLTGIAKRIDELGATSHEFLQKHCDGWPLLQARLRATSWEEICAKSGVARGEIDAVAERYAAAKRAVFAWTMGITHHVHGVENVQAIANLALMRGMVGRHGAGLLPIRGHSNVQGLGSIGVTPQLRQVVFDRLEQHFGVRLPTDPGLDTLSAVESAGAGNLKFGFCLGGNLYGSNPDANFVAAALGKLEMIVYLSTTLNTGHAHGLAQETLVLPVLARDEEPQATTQESMFNFVRLSDGGPARHAGTRSEVAILADLGKRIVSKQTPIDWQELSQTGQIRSAIARIVPGWEPLAEIGRTRQEFFVAGRRLAEPPFATPEGRARLFTHDLPELGQSERELRLMTVRSEGQFNTVVYEEYDLYRGQDRRDVILVHPSDLERLGIRADSWVMVRSAIGAVSHVLARSFEPIKPGNALMYYPEANVLVPRTADPRSRTPAFKNVSVTLEPLAAPAVRPRVSRGVQPAADAAETANSRGNMRSC